MMAGGKGSLDSDGYQSKCLTIFYLWHDSVAERQQSKEFLTMRVSGLECIGEIGVVKFERMLVVRVVRQIHWSHVLQKKT